MEKIDAQHRTYIGQGLQKLEATLESAFKSDAYWYEIEFVYKRKGANVTKLYQISAYAGFGLKESVKLFKSKWCDDVDDAAMDLWKKLQGGTESQPRPVIKRGPEPTLKPKKASAKAKPETVKA